MAIIVSKKGSHSAEVVNNSGFAAERNLQDYICEHPEAIPVYELREDKRLLVIAREFQTESGSIDALAVDKDGDIYIAETKLFRNPDKRTVLAQALDYGASLWIHADFNNLLSDLDAAAERQWKMPFREKLADFFDLGEDGTDTLLEFMRRNLSEGKLKFVVLMDKLDDGLKDLITYVNQNSRFDIYAVEIEFYKHGEYEIIIPRIYGAEVKKQPESQASRPAQKWTWELFRQRLSALGKEEVKAAREILDWAGENDVYIYWATNQRGSFILGFQNENGCFWPFSVTGKGMIDWNAPHQGKLSPYPFNKLERRRQILKRLGSVKGAVVDLKKVDGYSGLKLPLRALADRAARREFFSICTWIKEQILSHPT